MAGLLLGTFAVLAGARLPAVPPATLDAPPAGVPAKAAAVPPRDAEPPAGTIRFRRAGPGSPWRVTVR